MKLASECFNKVKKDCFKFIKSQETSKEKFSNKEGMLKTFLKHSEANFIELLFFFIHWMI